jgi:hypothetical protein
MRQTSLIVFMLLGLTGAAWSHASSGADVPQELVVDIRIFEARSASPDYQAMEELSFFIDTDGSDVTDVQWLATIAPKVPDSFLASLAFETMPVREDRARFELAKRSQKLDFQVDLSGVMERGTFEAPVSVRLERSDRVEREFEQTIELRVGQTYVFSAHGLELSPSEYLSHLRDYEGSKNRTELYRRLRESASFLIVALTPRIATDGGPTLADRVTLQLPKDVEVPKLESPFDIPVVGLVRLYFDVDANGVPQNIAIARSSLTEVNPLILAEASNWRFPQAAGKKAQLLLELKAEPNPRP